MSFLKSAIARSFNRAALSYDNSAVLQNVVGERLFERLDLVLVEPERVLDLGSGTGVFSRQLQGRYKKKKVLGIDLAWQMSAFANRQKKWSDRGRYICADAEYLPLADHSVDLVFSNLMLQWLPDPDRVFKEVQRVLVPGGLLMFSCFGPDTLKEMRQSWAQVDNNIHVNQFMDMHDIGDSLTNAAFSGVVMDNESISMEYESLDLLHQDLRDIGETNINVERIKGLTSKGHWREYLQAYKQFKNEQGEYMVSWEITYGHAWATEMAPIRKMETQTDSYNIKL
ncbi:MAG: malonyl-ACP O-methyltransferase BioC [Gammaproteobacteria bacterium]|nr:malonyl-ACP O-methyltransferase BioC [Gammaproteobacteria bacterium]